MTECADEEIVEFVSVVRFAYNLTVDYFVDVVSLHVSVRNLNSLCVESSEVKNNYFVFGIAEEIPVFVVNPFVVSCGCYVAPRMVVSCFDVAGAVTELNLEAGNLTELREIPRACICRILVIRDHYECVVSCCLVDVEAVNVFGCKTHEDVCLAVRTVKSPALYEPFRVRYLAFVDSDRRTCEFARCKDEYVSVVFSEVLLQTACGNRSVAAVDLVVVAAVCNLCPILRISSVCAKILEAYDACCCETIVKVEPCEVNAACAVLLSADTVIFRCAHCKTCDFSYAVSVCLRVVGENLEYSVFFEDSVDCIVVL